MIIINNYIDAKNYLRRYDLIVLNMESSMSRVLITQDITKYFIKTMIPHHQAAIFMANNLLKYTKYEPLIKIANRIISVQQRQIMEMQMIFKTTNNYINSYNEVNCYVRKYNDILKMMISKMKNAPRLNNINLDFTYEMIPHHMGAILMCKNLLNFKINPNLRFLAMKIIQFQSKGIQELKVIQKELKKENLN